MWTARNLIRNAWRAALAVAPVSCAAAAMFTVSHAASAKGGSEGRRTFETCPEVACKSQEELLAMFGTDPAPRRRRFPAGGGADGDSADLSSAAAAVSARSDCPPNREQLGRQAWAFLHTVAAYYPDHPTDEEKAAAKGLVEALRLLYPCSHCRTHLAVDLEKLPVDEALGSREALSLWMCKQHNFVNASLGKPEQHCSIDALDERWRRGRPECWLPPGVDASSAAAAAAAAAGVTTAEESMGRASHEEEDAERKEALA